MAEHDTLTDPELHEPKGISTAADKEFYVADGAGGGSWQRIAMGGLFALHFSTPLVVTGSGAAHVRLTTVETTAALASVANEVQANSDGSLQYTGTTPRHFHIALSGTISKAAGATTDGEARIDVFDDSASTWSAYTPSTIRFEAVASGSQHTITTHGDIVLDTNDKITLSLHNVTGANDLRVDSIYIFMMGMPH